MLCVHLLSIALCVCVFVRVCVCVCVRVCVRVRVRVCLGTPAYGENEK